MRICYTSDFHGSRTHYEQLTEMLRAARPELAILGGDMLPDGRDPDPPRDQSAWVASELRAHIKAFKRAVPDLTVAICMGNHDWRAAEEAIRQLENAGVLTLLETRRVWSLGGIQFLGCSYAPPSPHFVKDYERLDVDGDELPRFECDVLTWDGNRVRSLTVEEHFQGNPSIEKELAGLPTPPAPWIFVAHAPPFGTKLDRLPNVAQPIGSKAVRAFIERRKPLCALHGHVHESPDITHTCLDLLDGVPCINPGQGRERMRAVVFDTDDIPNTLRHTEFR